MKLSTPPSEPQRVRAPHGALIRYSIRSAQLGMLSFHDHVREISNNLDFMRWCARAGRVRSGGRARRARTAGRGADRAKIARRPPEPPACTRRGVGPGPVTGRNSRNSRYDDRRNRVDRSRMRLSPSYADRRREIRSERWKTKWKSLALEGSRPRRLPTGARCGRGSTPPHLPPGPDLAARPGARGRARCSRRVQRR